MSYLQSQGPAGLKRRVLALGALHLRGNQGVVGRVAHDGDAGVVLGRRSEQCDPAYNHTRTHTHTHTVDQIFPWLRPPATW